MGGARAYKQKLPPHRRKKKDIFRREHPFAGIPLVVVAVPGVDVPLTVVGVPVDVHHASALSYPRPSVPLPIEYSPGCI